ncbi:rCG61669 [Rattus norvegicus]|uniref:RCG61669 n=1 Tax=Rattus norvegicus TaxID=10116 RepID=A6H9X3_RAT|nr:rCG61669 [Rattus norvegicus]
MKSKVFQIMKIYKSKNNSFSTLIVQQKRQGKERYRARHGGSGL